MDGMGMQMPGKPQGGLPPALMQAPPNAGPITVPQANQGNITAAIAKIQNAMKMLEESLPMIPMGSPLHTEVLNTIKGMSKQMKNASENPQLQQASLMNQLRSNSADSNKAAMMRMLATQNNPGAAPAMGGGTPPMPPAQPPSQSPE